MILKTETKLYLRDPTAVILTLCLPTMIMVVLGLIPALRKPDPTFDNHTFVSYFAPSLLVLTLVMAGLTVLPSLLATYRERGMLRRMRTTPASPGALLVAQLLIVLTSILASSALLITVSRLAFDVPLPQDPIGFLIAFVIGTAALLALGLLVAARARTTKAASAIGTPIFLVIMFFGGVYLPRFLLPEFLVRIGDYTPPGVQALLDAWSGTSPEPLQLGIMALVAVVAGVAAARLFRWE
ncbi:ABC transporter permease [Plantactinospora sp. GCM10030261]|uniref:ABC transporter permease n=1 Tax=Plantactinospora sp. GCM10030261 TaxID=3273420 RepID=UPI00361AB9C5